MAVAGREKDGRERVFYLVVVSNGALFLAIICSGIILLVTALALRTPDAGALTIAVQQRVLPR